MKKAILLKISNNILFSFIQFISTAIDYPKDQNAFDPELQARFLEEDDEPIEPEDAQETPAEDENPADENPEQMEEENTEPNEKEPDQPKADNDPMEKETEPMKDQPTEKPEKDDKPTEKNEQPTETGPEKPETATEPMENQTEPEMKDQSTEKPDENTEPTEKDTDPTEKATEPPTEKATEAPTEKATEPPTEKPEMTEPTEAATEPTEMNTKPTEMDTTTEKDMEEECSIENQEMMECLPDEPITCINMDDYEEKMTGTCKKGCACKNGYVMNEEAEKCVLPKMCLCERNGKSYRSGDRVKESCNTCICEEMEWFCTNREC